MQANANFPLVAPSIPRSIARVRTVSQGAGVWEALLALLSEMAQRR